MTRFSRTRFNIRIRRIYLGSKVGELVRALM